MPRLLDAAQLEQFARELQPRFSEPRTLAGELIRRDWLTPYQANLLLQGRGQELLLGSYVLLERIGEGGMGAVFKARNWKLGRTVALKLIRKERVDNPDAVRRFQREIRAAAQLDHPNIVRAIDADEIGGTHLLVMEYVPGSDLAKLVKKAGPLSVDRACDYCPSGGARVAARLGARPRPPRHQAAEPPADAGRGGKDPRHGVGPVGARQEASEASSTMTREGTVMGTLDYIAPSRRWIRTWWTSGPTCTASAARCTSC